MALDPENEPVWLDGPAFCNKTETVISYKGDNFYKACSSRVTQTEDGTSGCVKRIGHPGDIHEDYDGNLYEGPWPTEEKPEKLFDWTTSTPIEEAVFQALGAASACWENLEGAGIFESTRCKQIGDELVEYINSKQPIY